MDDIKSPGQQYSGASYFASDVNFEVQRTNHFEIVLDLKQTLGIDETEIEHIRLSTKEVSTPKVTAEAIPLKHGNDTVKVASAPQYDDLTITVYDTIGKDQLDILQKWFNKVFDYNTKLMGLASNYKTTGTLYMYSPDCSKVRKWKLEGVWPRSFGVTNSFSFDSTSEQNITLELSVDRYHEETHS